MSFEGLPKGSGDKKRSFRESIYLWEILRGLGVTARTWSATSSTPTTCPPCSTRRRSGSTATVSGAGTG